MSPSPTQFRDLTRGVSKNLATLRVDLPDVMKGFSALAQAATRDGALGEKTKDLIALALGMAVHMGGGPSLMYAANALGAFEEFSAAA